MDLKAPRYVVSSTPPLPRPSQAQLSSSATCVPPSVWATVIHKLVSNSIEDLLSHKILRHTKTVIQNAIQFWNTQCASPHSCGTHRTPTAFFSSLKRPERLACLLPRIGAEVKSGWSYTSIPSIFLHGVRLYQAHGHFTFMCNITTQRARLGQKMNSKEMKEESCSNVMFEKRV
jgi:hypothetical protein